MGTAGQPTEAPQGANNSNSWTSTGLVSCAWPASCMPPFRCCAGPREPAGHPSLSCPQRRRDNGAGLPCADHPSGGEQACSAFAFLRILPVVTSLASRCSLISQPCGRFNSCPSFHVTAMFHCCRHITRHICKQSQTRACTTCSSTWTVWMSCQTRRSRTTWRMPTWSCCLMCLRWVIQQSGAASHPRPAAFAQPAVPLNEHSMGLAQDRGRVANSINL